VLPAISPSVISNASIAKPINEVIRTVFLGKEGYGNTRLRREPNSISIESGEEGCDKNSHQLL